MSGFYHINDRYYQWEIEVFNQAINGCFVSFRAKTDNPLINMDFPVGAGYEFAFCPIVNLQHFSSLGTPLDEVPDYIRLFNYADLKKMNLIIRR